MDEFSYLSVLISVILGLAVTQILKGFRGILLSRARVRIYWPVIACCTLASDLFAELVVDVWDAKPARLDVPPFTMVLLNTVFIYMMTALVFPDFFGEGVVDLKENFYAQRGWFFTLAFSTIVISVCKDIALDGRLPNTTNLIFHVIFGVTLFIGASIALGALPQRTCCFWQRALRRLYRRAFRTNSIGSTQSSHQPFQDFDNFHAPAADLFSVRGR
jgi:hypothetical protein